MKLFANVGDLVCYTIAQVGHMHGMPYYWGKDTVAKLYGIVIRAESHNVVAATDISDIYASAFYDIYFFDGVVTTVNDIDFELGFARVISKAEVRSEEENT
tara:strand:+ start:1091 stop:1393 length:303 start_codon:yes stop_codon:yes gene_type:complete